MSAPPFLHIRKGKFSSLVVFCGELVSAGEPKIDPEVSLLRVGGGVQPPCPACLEAMRKMNEVVGRLVDAKIPVAYCRSCGDPIVWIVTNAGKNMPVDAGTIEAGDEVFVPERHRSHFATCVHAAHHRKPRT